MSKVQAEATGPVLFRNRCLAEETLTFKVAVEVTESYSPRIQVLTGPGKLDILLARLRSIAGDHNVGAPTLRNSHKDDEVTLSPFQPSVFSGSVSESKPSCFALRRLRPAEPVKVSLRNGAPFLLHWKGERFELAEATGPWQSSGYWWDGRTWETNEWDAIVSQPLHALRLRYEHGSKAWTVAGVYD